VRGSVELASPVAVERSSFIFKAMGKRSRPNCDNNGCKCKKQRKAVTLGENYQLFTLRVFVLRDDFSERINRVIRGFAVYIYIYIYIYIYSHTHTHTHTHCSHYRVAGGTK
jgi:hypothetical protein